MSIFKRKQKKEEVKETWAAAQAEESSEPIEVEEVPVPEEEWVWVEGYKGTDANMCCRGYQYEIGKRFDMPEGENIKTCDNGFHLCLRFKSVFDFYNIGQGNRFFKVKALVRKKDKERAEMSSSCTGMVLNANGTISWGCQDKIAAKSIIFVSELTQDEILKGTEVEKLSKKYKDIAINVDVKTARNTYQASVLEKDGYSKAFAAHIVNNGLFDKAHAVGSQSDLSMDMKVLWILS